MSVDQPRWPNLSQRTRSRLTAFTDPLRPGVTTAPCRLPGCDERVERRDTSGRPRFFHDRKCAIEFRTRRSALDAAVEELAELLESGHHTTRDANRIRADLEWLLDQRSLYVAPGAWRHGPSDAAPADANSPATDAYLNSAYLARRKPSPIDPCPTCKGGGDLSHLRAEITRPRNGRDYQAEARLARRAKMDALARLAAEIENAERVAPNLAWGDAMLEVRRMAAEAERHLMKSLNHEAGG
ncbi:hypothetical protein [Nocardioides jiangxiensis]|uniref:Uncharacterized protein n=1 Tax=Nocardioides jiangxiensis TaxID=3064524 RepID=A0ABT9B098_9ACTN|nr:hypothetical protein [Nocardioides sp. WY-20]MDO7868165.1 hypothetical protein [Nocardioides sp. WY-20]